jgi:hypothetical protein
LYRKKKFWDISVNQSKEYTGTLSEEMLAEWPILRLVTEGLVTYHDAKNYTLHDIMKLNATMDFLEYHENININKK